MQRTQLVVPDGAFDASCRARSERHYSRVEHAMSLVLSQQLRAMSNISAEAYEFGKQIRDRANLVQSFPAVKHPPLCLSYQLLKMQNVDQRLFEAGSQVRDALNVRAQNPGKKQPALQISEQLATMRRIDQRLFEYFYQVVGFINAL